MEYRPKLKIKQRPSRECSFEDDRFDYKSLWINMPDGEDWNIGDMPKEDITLPVRLAIKHAFELGFQARVQLHHQELCCSVEVK